MCGIYSFIIKVNNKKIVYPILLFDIVRSDKNIDTFATMPMSLVTNDNFFNEYKSLYLERPQEVAGMLELLTNSEDFVNQIFSTDNVFTSCKKQTN